MNKNLIDGIFLSLRQLIPFSNIEVKSPEKKSADRKISTCQKINSREFIITINSILKNSINVQVKRTRIDFSHNELKILKSIPELIDQLMDTNSTVFYTYILKFCNRISFSDLISAYFLAAGSPDNLWPIINVLLILQELTDQKYEEQTCTSGFVFSLEPDIFIKSLTKTPYQFYPFTTKPKLDFSYFSSPATYRYVDGRNSYYLVDRELNIHGVLRLTNPSSFTLVHRIGNRHLQSLIRDSGQKTLIAFSGIKEDIFVIFNLEQQLKWYKNNWIFRDRSLINTILKQFRFKAVLNEVFINTLFALSELNSGSIILIPENEKNLPRVIGKIDNSQVGELLRKSIQCTNIYELSLNNSLIGILASDGLTTISKNGLIISCGDIIDINYVKEKKLQGGGRSISSITASYYGLAIKVSQDGDISFFHQGECIFHLW